MTDPRRLAPIRSLPLACALACAILAVGCDRSHMQAGYGRSLRVAFARQVIDKSAGDKVSGSMQGLDPQEAAIVVETYRKSLSPRGDADAARHAPVMLLPPPPAGAYPAPGLGPVSPP